MKLMAGGGRPQLIAGVVQTITAPSLIVAHPLGKVGAGFYSIWTRRMARGQDVAGCLELNSRRRRCTMCLGEALFMYYGARSCRRARTNHLQEHCGGLYSSVFCGLPLSGTGEFRGLPAEV